MRVQAGYLPDIGEEQYEIKVLTFNHQSEQLEIEIPLLTNSQLAKVAAKVKAASVQYLKSMPVSSIISIIDRAIDRLLDKRSPYRQKAEELLPIITGYDRELIRTGLTSFLKTFRKPQLQRFLVEDTGNPQLLDEFQPRVKGGYAKAIGPDLAVHIWAGNVPALPLWSLISGLLVKSGNIGKVSSAEPLFAGLFANILAEIEPRIADCLAVVWWKGGDEEREQAVFKQADVVLAYGGNEALECIRRHVPVTTRFLTFGHKISFGIVSVSCLHPRKAWETAHQAALDVIRYDQQGCYSPHLFYIQNGGAVSPGEFAKYIAHELECFEKRYPRRILSLEEMAGVASWRNNEELSLYSSAAKEVLGQASFNWQVIYEENGLFSPTCLNRTVKVIGFDRIEDIIPQLRPFRPFLQTAGVAAAPQELFQYAELLGQAGVTRITALGKMASPEAGWHHDGRFNLLDLIQMVDIEHSAEEYSEQFAPYTD